MVELYLQKNSPFSGAEFVAVVVSGSEEQRHAGLFYCLGGEEEVCFLHLGFHYQLRREIPKEHHCWLKLTGFDAIERQSLATWIDAIWKENGNRVPYGINYSNSKHFNNKGAFIAADDDGGLTCATFLLALFQDYGFPVIDTATSYRRDNDVEWQKKIIDCLSGFAPKDYIESQKEFLGIAARYRPEEVAGSVSALIDEPLDFDTAINLGAIVLTKMGELGAFKS